jgi:hypothetical protein
MAHVGSTVDVRAKVTAPLREERAVAKTFHVCLDIIPLDTEDKSLWIFDALMEYASAVSFRLCNDGSGYLKALAHGISLPRSGANNGDFDNHVGRIYSRAHFRRPVLAGEESEWVFPGAAATAVGAGEPRDHGK